MSSSVVKCVYTMLAFQTEMTCRILIVGLNSKFSIHFPTTSSQKLLELVAWLVTPTLSFESFSEKFVQDGTRTEQTFCSVRTASDLQATSFYWATHWESNPLPLSRRRFRFLLRLLRKTWKRVKDSKGVRSVSFGSPVARTVP